MKAALALLGLLAGPVQGMELHRGVNTEIWVDWLGVQEMLSRPGFLQTYPDYPRHMPPGTLDKIAKQGVDFLRIAADPSVLLATSGAARQALIAQLRDRVQEALAAGLSVILDLHAFPRAGFSDGPEYGVDWALDSPANFAAYVQMAGEVAAGLHGLPPDRVAFQPMNEPTQDCEVLARDPTRSTWPDRLAMLHSAARQGAPDLALVLSGACWGGAWGLSFLDPQDFNDANLMWSFHSYDPFAYSHQGADWTHSPLQYLQGLPYPPDLLTDPQARAKVDEALTRAPPGTPRAALENIVQDYRASGGALQAEITRAATWADAHAIPRDRVLLDEFGAVWIDDQGQPFGTDDHSRYLADKVAAAEAAGFAWGLWDWRGSMRFGTPGYGLDPRVCRATGLGPC